MRILAVAGNKGGIGKTSLTRLLAEYFGRSGRAVLVIDLDPQSNLSRRFIEMDYDPSDPDGVLPPLHPDYEEGDPDWSGRSSSADVYFHGEVYPYPTRWEGLHLLPGHGPRLRTVELVTEEEVKDKVVHRLRDFAASMLTFDLPVMLAVAVACLPIFFTGNLITRWKGGLFFAYYLAYVGYLILMTGGNDALQPFNAILGYFVLPLTFVALAVLALRHWHTSR